VVSGRLSDTRHRLHGELPQKTIFFVWPWWLDRFQWNVYFSRHLLALRRDMREPLAFVFPATVLEGNHARSSSGRLPLPVCQRAQNGTRRDVSQGEMPPVDASAAWRGAFAGCQRVCYRSDSARPHLCTPTLPSPAHRSTAQPIPSPSLTLNHATPPGGMAA
jgi:hypothetical protein